MRRVALVTGGSSGIGRAAALALREKGFQVYEISRHPQSLGDIEHLTADVTDEESVRNAIQAIWQTEGRLDVVVNNAGFGIAGGVEFTDAADVGRLFDVNVLGMVRVNRAVLPLMREAGGGRIIHISSVAAVTPIPFQTFYSVSKAAVNAYTMALANEVRPFGITVCAVMPGDIQTGFTAARETTPEGDDLYNGRIRRSVARMERDEQNGMKPQRIGSLVAALAVKKHVKPFYTCGAFYHLVLVLAKVLPAGLLNRMLGWMYAK